MSSKSLIIGSVVFSLLVLVGSYFLIFGGKQSTAKQVISYSVNDKERPKAEVKNNFSDMGQMKVSQQKAVDFIVKNVGQKPLQLFNISSSCGCTVGQVVINGEESEEFGMHSQSDYVGEVAPGNQAIVRVIYRPYVMPVYGPVEREVYVSTNDPEKKKLVFKVKAFVK